MTQQPNHDFDLSIESTDEGCFAHVTGSPVGAALVPFRVPFNTRDLMQFWQEICAASMERGGTSGRSAKLREAGGRLFQSLCYGEVLSCWQMSNEHAQSGRGLMRLRLNLADVPEFFYHPWEYLYDPVREEHLSLSLQAPLVRYSRLRHQILPLKAPSPLRVLVVIAGPSSYPDFNPGRSWIQLVDTIDYLAKEGKLVVERLNKPTLLDFQRRLRQGDYHIVHFIGYSLFDRQTGEGQLLFEDEVGRSRLVSGQHLGGLLRDHYPLRLFILQGPGNLAAEVGPSPYMHVAESLVQRGVAAVIAPRFALPFAADLVFTRQLYAEIAALQPIDLAAVAARRALYNEQFDVAWGAPALFSRIPDGRLFDDGSIVHPRVPDEVRDSVAARLNSLRIRTANLDTIASWGTEVHDPRKDRTRRTGWQPGDWDRDDR
jgi:hypothetical protein